MNSLNLIQIIILVLCISLALIYMIPVLVIRRFHHINNVFTVNLCLAVIICCDYWLSFYIVFEFYPRLLSSDPTCVVFNFLEMMCTIQVPLAVIEVSVHRLCSIVYYTKSFFKKKKWGIISIASHWTAGIIFSFPRISFNDPYCGTQFWRRIYILIMIVIMPSIICFINNIIILYYVRSSTNRIQTLSTTTENNQAQQSLNRRDLHMLRHMIVMFCIFLGGWSPIYIYSSFATYVDFRSTEVSLLMLLAELSLLFDIIDLFLYNHELRRYLQEKILK